MRVLRVLIDRDAVQKTACDKWAVDLPVLEAMYENIGSVTVLEEYEVEAERTPEEEYERLKRTYGKNSTGIYWAEYVYGRNLAAIAQAMAGPPEVFEQKEPPVTSEVAKKKPGKRKPAE